MTEAPDVASLYMQYGAAGLCIILFAWMVIYFIVSINPRLKKLEENSLVVTEILRQSNDIQAKSNDIIDKTHEVLRENQKVIENNTQAFLNFSQAMQNITGFISVQGEDIKDIQGSIDEISKDVVRLTERANK